MKNWRATYCPTGGVLIIDNFAHSSRPAAVICFASATTLQDRTPASTSIRNVVSSAFRTTVSALCLLHPLQYPIHDPHDCHSSHPQLHVRPSKRICSRTRLTILSNLNTGSTYILFCHLVHNRSRQYRSLKTTPCTAARRRSRGRDTPPFVLSCGGRRDIAVTADLRGVPSLDVEETSERAYAVSSPTQYTCYWIIRALLFSVEYMGLVQSTNSSSSASSKPSGRSHAYPRTSLFTLIRFLRLLHLHARAVLYSRTE